MSKLILGSKPRELLTEVLESRRPDLLQLVDETGRRTLTSQQRDELRDTVLDEFCATGLLDNDEPNDRGLALEALIDWLRLA